MIGNDGRQESVIGTKDSFVYRARWLALSPGEPCFPPAAVIEYAVCGFDEAFFREYEVPLFPKLGNAVSKRRAEFLAGRIAAQLAIERLGVNASIPAIGRAREPIWQTGVTGSITHTNGVAGAVAVPSSTARGVGIDFETIIEPQARDAIREYIISTDECAVLEESGQTLSEALRLTIVFSAKESFFKGTFATVGRYFGFDAVRLVSFDARSGSLVLTVRDTLCPLLPAGRAFRIVFTTITNDIVATLFCW
jgi:enterobactin synthetase component D